MYWLFVYVLSSMGHKLYTKAYNWYIHNDGLHVTLKWKNVDYKSGFRLWYMTELCLTPMKQCISFEYNTFVNNKLCILTCDSRMGGNLDCNSIWSDNFALQWATNDMGHPSVPNKMLPIISCCKLYWCARSLVFSGTWHSCTSRLNDELRLNSFVTISYRLFVEQRGRTNSISIPHVSLWCPIKVTFLMKGKITFM